MSLWEKWEREELKKQGIKVEEPRNVTVRPMRIKTDYRKQAWIVAGAFFACLAVVAVSLALGNLLGWKWSDTYIARLFVNKQLHREAISNNP
jgi:hypothetical protein